MEMKNKQHNSRRRYRNYHSKMNSLAYAMVKGDVNSVKDCLEKVVRYQGGMDRRDCEEFLREFRAEMEEQVPSKQQLAINKEKRKQRKLVN